MNEESTSTVVASKLPCPSCNSSDALALYDDGHTHCFSCGHHTNSTDSYPLTREKERMPLDLIEAGVYQDIAKRNLTEETCRKFGYSVGEFNNQKVQIASYRKDGEVVGQKVRFSNKDFIALGDLKSAGFFGKHLCVGRDKMLVITEGEIDCLSVSQVLNHRWPVVSLPFGAKGARKSIQADLEWLERFETVVLMFDEDEYGKTAVKECIDLFTPGRCKVASLPLKDANAMLVEGREADLVAAVWGAKVMRPDGIVAGTEAWDRYNVEPENDALPFPPPKLQAKTKGARRGELITVTSGSGMGKTEWVGQTYFDWLLNSNETLGLIHLEENMRRTMDRMVGLQIGRRIHIDRDGLDKEVIKAAFDATVGSGRVFLYDHFGSTDDENLFAKIKYFAKGCNCTTIVLDHLSIVVSGIAEGDERRLIDNIMTRLATMAQELNVRIILISHLKKPDGTPHEEGGRVSLDDLRGSGSIKHLSHTIIALERDQQDELLKHYTLLRVLKCRFTGDTGEADWLHFDPVTGRLSPCEPPPGEGEAPRPKNHNHASDF